MPIQGLEIVFFEVLAVEREGDVQSVWNLLQDHQFSYLMNQLGLSFSYSLVFSSSCPLSTQDLLYSYLLSPSLTPYFSGLDSKSSRKTIELLKNLAKTKKKTILLTIHQSNSLIFQLFDKVMLLSGGNQVFFTFSNFFGSILIFSLSDLLWPP